MSAVLVPLIMVCVAWAGHADLKRTVIVLAVMFAVMASIVLWRFHKADRAWERMGAEPGVEGRNYSEVERTAAARCFGDGRDFSSLP